MPDQRLGERACAFLVPTGVEVSLQDIRAHLESLGVAKYKWLERLVWLDSLRPTPRCSASARSRTQPTPDSSCSPTSPT